MELQIRHTGQLQDDKPQFVVVYNGKSTPVPVSITPPGDVPVGTYNTNLQRELHWYLEKYLEIPIDNFRIRAQEIQKALSGWGRSCFDQLFGSDHGRDWYRDARKENLSDLRLKIASDDPAILSWPWEAVESRDDGLLAQQCRIERQLDDIGDVHPIKNPPPSDQLNILYIIARPYGDRDVGFQTLARPLIDFANKGGWPVHIDVLRPPTFDRLRAVLEEKPNFYHIVHFDGHGGFGSLPGPGMAAGLPIRRDKLAAPTGALVFEDQDHSGDLISATILGQLLRKHNIPAMVLNACQSAMLDENAEDPFSSVATSLLKAGIRSVVAMSYSLWVSGAKVFVPAFYRRLFKDGDMARAMQAGREEMYRNQMRDTFTGQVAFHDWIVPVLYQQADGFLPKLTPGKRRESELPVELRDLGDYGFIGREKAIQDLERAIRGTPPGILIQGMAGEGKTTLVKGFLQWLEATNGLRYGAFWFSFEDIHSAGYVIDELTGKLFGTQAMALQVEQKLAPLTQVLKEHPFLIVWDNFESASGIPDTEVSPLLSDDDRALLKEFLYGLRGGATKVLITSRSPESWLRLQECCRLPLEGLKGEELWQYCNAVVADLGPHGTVTLDRESETYKNLMDTLHGNPLAVRAILLRLREKTAEALLAELENAFNGIEGDEGTKRIQAALSVFERGLDQSFAPALRLLGLHEHYTDGDFIGYMLQGAGDTATPIKGCFTALESAGLCRSVGNNVYQIHPALRDCLARLHPAEEANKRAFVDVMGSLSDAYAQKELHEQRVVFTLFSATFHRALRLAQELDMGEDVLALMRGLAHYALNTRNFSEAERLYTQLAEAAKEYGNANAKAGAYGQLGRIAQERRDFDTAEKRYKQALDIFLALGDEDNAAVFYHQLGIVAAERRDFDAAKDWYQKALAIDLKQGNEHGAASTYHQLGRVAQTRRDFDAAEDWYKKSLVINLKLGNEHDAASTYHQLGIVAQTRRDFDAAEDWYKKALEIKQKLKMYGNSGIETTYHELGIVAQKRQDFDTAEDLYKKALAIKLKLGNEHGAASTYHQLGRIAEERRDFDAAEDWYKKSLAILERNDPHSAEIVKNSLARLNNHRNGGAPQ